MIIRIIIIIFVVIMFIIIIIIIIVSIIIIIIIIIFIITIIIQKISMAPAQAWHAQIEKCNQWQHSLGVAVAAGLTAQAPAPLSAVWLVWQRRFFVFAHRSQAMCFSVLPEAQAANHWRLACRHNRKRKRKRRERKEKEKQETKRKEKEKEKMRKKENKQKRTKKKDRK